MIRLEGGASGRVRVIGQLEGPAVKLFEAISRGAVVLDLSEVDRPDESAVMFLADLAHERCKLTACPSWLSRWMDRFRRPAGQHLALADPALAGAPRSGER